MKTSDISVEYLDHMGSDLSIINAARVSFAKESDWEFDDLGDGHLSVSDARLINYLAKHKHYSPFNHTFLTVRIKAPIFVARQLVKHEYMPWNEVSRRYVDDEPEFYFPEGFRPTADNVKQGSGEGFIVDADNDLVHGLSEATERCLMEYAHLLQRGVCAEQARMILPQNTMTEWIWSGTLKAFHKMLALRLDPHTQYETRLVAEKILPIAEQYFPISTKALFNES